MPELPEVETMRRGVEPIVGARILSVERTRCPRKPIEIKPPLPTLRRRLEGARIERTARAGKRVVLWTDRDDALVFEPRMTGLVLLSDPPPSKVAEGPRRRGARGGIPDPPDPMYTRLRLRLSDNRRRERNLLYWDRRGLGSVGLFSHDQFAEHFGPHKLGPDALDMTAERYAERLGRSPRPIKVALLDQKAVAGIGNLYASEILHQAHVHPATPCRALKPRHWQAIADAALDVLQTAIRYEGSTLSDGTYRNALNQEGGYQNHHRVYDREEAACPNCNRGRIQRIVQAQRSTFFCPNCQTKK